MEETQSNATIFYLDDYRRRYNQKKLREKIWQEHQKMEAYKQGKDSLDELSSHDNVHSFPASAKILNFKKESSKKLQ